MEKGLQLGRREQNHLHTHTLTHIHTHISTHTNTNTNTHILIHSSPHTPTHTHTYTHILKAFEGGQHASKLCASLSSVFISIQEHSSPLCLSGSPSHFPSTERATDRKREGERKTEIDERDGRQNSSIAIERGTSSQSGKERKWDRERERQRELGT